MDLYRKLCKKPVFTMQDVDEYYNNIGSARSAVKRLLAYQKAFKIRNNLYTCSSAETDTPIADRFEIASKITETSYVSHHSAMEYYGITDQVFNYVYVSSETRFKNFEFNGYYFVYVNSGLSDGVVNPARTQAVRLTDKERTITDCIKDMDKIAGLEEVYSNLECFSFIDEDKLLRYLSLYDNKFLYQKTGFLLSSLENKANLSDDFYKICKDKSGKSTRYLTTDYKKGTFNKAWNLIVPPLYKYSKNGLGVDDIEV